MRKDDAGLHRSHAGHATRFQEAVRRRGAGLMGAVAAATAIAALGLGAALQYQSKQVDQAQARELAAPEPMDLATYEKVQELRRGLRMTNADLADMEASPEQTEAALEALVASYETHRVALAQAEQAEVDALRALREAQRQISVGPRDESVVRRIPRLEEQLASAQAERARVASRIGQSAERVLGPQRARAHAGPRTNLSGVERQRHGTTSTAQRQQLAEDVAQRARGVRTAEASVMRMPRELQRQPVRSAGFNGR